MPQDEPPPNTYSMNECDTNADTCCLGSNFIIMGYTNRTADVYPYDKSYDPIENVPIVSGATAYDDKESGTTYILIFNESLYYGTKLSHSLINPNQVRHNHIDLWDNPYDKQHELGIETPNGPHIPFTLEGTKIKFQTRSPTQKALETCPRIVMTSQDNTKSSANLLLSSNFDL